MHCGPKFLTAIVWLLVSLGAIHLGLIALGFDILQQPFIQNSDMLRQVVVPLHWLIGAAGVWSLILYAQWVMGGCHECNCKK